MTHEPFSSEISAWTREMSAPGNRRSGSLRRPMVNSGLSIGTMRRPSASVTTRRGAGGISTIQGSAHYIFVRDARASIQAHHRVRRYSLQRLADPEERKDHP